MSVVSLLDVKILNNPAPFTEKYRLEITFECLEQLQKGGFSFSSNIYFISRVQLTNTPARVTDLEWKLTYVGSATSCVLPLQSHNTILY